MVARVEGKVAVVTGAARGIGRGCAEMLAREGTRVVIGDVRDADGEAVVAAIRAAGGDASVRAFGRLDILVNNVGWFPRATLEETTTALWERVLNVNLRGAFYCCKHAVPHLRAAGGAQHRQHRLDQRHPGFAQCRRVRHRQGWPARPDPHPRRSLRGRPYPRQLHHPRLGAQ